MIRIAVDAFGGDNAPGAIIQGCVQAAREHDDITIILTGDEKVIAQKLAEFNADTARFEIVQAPEVITNDEHPVAAIKAKKNSSLVKALELVAEKQAQAFVSAGSTGAVLAGATLLVRRIPGIKRPALAPVLPTAKGPVLLIDCGANIDCKPQYLQQFGIMGSIYMEKVLGIKNPRVGLINNGAEKGKGNALTVAAYELLENTPINFMGNIEGRDLTSGDFDVAVCDGFVGNVLMKFLEGAAATIFDMLKKELLGSLRTKLGTALAKPALKKLKRKLDYTEYGGALLIGIDGGIVKAHGSSNAKSIKSAISQARTFTLNNVADIIKESVKNMDLGE